VLAARRRLLAELERPGTVGFACHFGDQAFGRRLRHAERPGRAPGVNSSVAATKSPKLPRIQAFIPEWYQR
jgi:hypothetical protein